MLLLIVGQVGCAALPKMQADRPIEIHRGVLGAIYKQNGVAIDSNDMQDRIALDREAAPDVSKARKLTFVATALGAVGGALIGWPIGQKIAGDEDPIWPLAYAGAGTIALSIPFAIWSNASLNSAVETFNQHLPRPDDAPSVK